MTDYFTLFKDWLIVLGEKHKVDPLLLGGLYLVSKLCFFTSLGWVLKTLRARKPILIPVMFAAVSLACLICTW